jgi:hypothetical protein
LQIPTATNLAQATPFQSADDAIRPLRKNRNECPFQKLPGCRASAFAELDAPALQPLPLQSDELARFKTVTVYIDYHVEIDKHPYSVPHALVGLKPDARITAGTVDWCIAAVALLATPAMTAWTVTPRSSSKIPAASERPPLRTRRQAIASAIGE